jgi:hypothetical protein
MRNELVLKGILSANKCFQAGKRLILFQIGLFSKVEEIYLSLKRNLSVLEAEASSTLLPCKNSVLFARSPSCKLGVSWWR